jgi:hypothetical protein
MELLGLFANQAAISIDLLRKARAAKSVLDDGSTDIAALARLAANLDALEGPRRQAASELLSSLETLFKD